MDFLELWATLDLIPKQTTYDSSDSLKLRFSSTGLASGCTPGTVLAHHTRALSSRRRKFGVRRERAARWPPSRRSSSSHACFSTECRSSAASRSAKRKPSGTCVIQPGSTHWEETKCWSASRWCPRRSRVSSRCPSSSTSRSTPALSASKPTWKMWRNSMNTWSFRSTTSFAPPDHRTGCLVPSTRSAREASSNRSCREKKAAATTGNPASLRGSRCFPFRWALHSIRRHCQCVRQCELRFDGAQTVRCPAFQSPRRRAPCRATAWRCKSESVAGYAWWWLLWVRRRGQLKGRGRTR